MIHLNRSTQFNLPSIFIPQQQLGAPLYHLFVFQTVTFQTVVLVAAAVHCVLSGRTTRKNNIVMFSQHEY